MATLRVTFEYEADPANYDTDNPDEMAQIDQENVENGVTDIGDLFDEDAIDNVRITAVSG